MEAFLGPRVGRSLGRWLVLSWGLGCQALETQPVDYQVDVLDAQPEGVAQVRLCVRNFLMRTQGAREAKPNYLLLGAGDPLSLPLVVELLDANKGLVAQAEVAKLQSYVTTRLNSCENEPCEPCTAPESKAQNGDETWALAVRFLP